MCAASGSGQPSRCGRAVNSENWHEERHRLVRLLKGIESGEVTHIDEEDRFELKATSPAKVVVLKERLAKLNARLSLD